MAQKSLQVLSEADPEDIILINDVDEIPNLKTFVGIFIIVISGIYIFIREKAQDQSIVTDKPLR